MSGKARSLLLFGCVLYWSPAECAVIAPILPCESDGPKKVSKEWCIKASLPEGQSVVILGRRGCVGKTGKARTVSTMIEDTPGTEFRREGCESIEPGDKALIGEAVRSFHKLHLAPAKPSDLEQLVRMSPTFKALSPDGAPSLSFQALEIEKRGRSIQRFFVSFGEEGRFPLVVENGVVRSAAEGENLCSSPPSGFRLNYQDYLEVFMCQCGTDGCITKYFELKK